MKGIITCECCGERYEWIAYQKAYKNIKDCSSDGYPKSIDFVFMREGKHYCYARCPKCLTRKEIEMENKK